MSELRRTPLYALQRERGARFVPFGDWELPVQYSGVVAEHHAVRRQAGLFDVSHMGEFLLTGPGAFAALQNAVTNDLARLGDGEAIYTVMCRTDGGIVDDLIIYRVAAEHYFVVVNAGRCAADWQHLAALVEPYDCVFEDQSDSWAQLALQGPKAMSILARLTEPGFVAPKPFGFADMTVAGCAGVRVARTGYTGEDGVELYCRPADAPALWRAIEEAGASDALALCGLGARDTLRLEAKFALYGNDIDEQHNPYEAGLGWVVKLAKGDFVGADSLRTIKESGPQRKLVAFVMRDRGIARHGYPVYVDGAEVGVVTSGSHSPSLGEAIGLAYVPTAHAGVGSTLEIMIRNRAVAAEVVKAPFYKRESK